MISMRYKDLLHPRIQQVLGKVSNTPMDPTQSYEVNKLLAAIRKEITRTREESAKTLKTFVKFENEKPVFKKDAEGEFVLNPATQQPEVEFIEPYNHEHPDYVAAFEAFDTKETSIEFRPWSLQMLRDNGVKLSPAEIDVLGPLLTDKPFLSAVEDKYN
jgi:hypothetical protein